MHSQILSSPTISKNCISWHELQPSICLYWLAGIVAVVLGVTTIFLEINRSIDKKTIAEAVQGKAEVETWKADLKQWMSENPKEAKSFIEWSKKRIIGQ